MNLLLCLAMLFSVDVVAEAPEVEEGFTAIFDGKTLTGWTGEAKKHFAIESGVLRSRPGCQGALFTEQEYGDFVLRFDFKLTPGGNSGIGIRAPLTGNPSFTGHEVQILDNSAEKYKDLKDYQYHGSVYGIVPAKRGALRPVGEWNSQEIRFEGPSVQVILNGETIVDANLDEAAPNGKAIDGESHPGLQQQRGRLAILCHNDEISFKNIRVKVLDK